MIVRRRVGGSRWVARGPHRLHDTLSNALGCLGRVTLPAVIFVLSRRRSKLVRFQTSLPTLELVLALPRANNSVWVVVCLQVLQSARTQAPLSSARPHGLATSLLWAQGSGQSAAWAVCLLPGLAAPPWLRSPPQPPPGDVEIPTNSLPRGLQAPPAWLVLPTGPRQVSPLLPGLVTSLGQKSWRIGRLLKGGGTAR